MKTKCEIFKKHKYRDKRVKMSNQTYVDQMCEKKKKQLLEKIVSYNSAENLKLLVKKKKNPSNQISNTAWYICRRRFLI